MKRILLAYQIRGLSVGIDLPQWNSEDLKGNSPFKIIESDKLLEENISKGYIDISSILNWDLFGTIIANDYLVCKNSIKEIYKNEDWFNLNNLEKKVIIKYDCYKDDINELIKFLIENEKYSSEEDAKNYILENKHKHYLKIINSCKQRWYYSTFVFLKYLSSDDFEDLTNNIESLIFTFINNGRFGINYGDRHNGIMDFIESTNSYSNNGLKENNYKLLINNWESFINDLKYVLIEGIYIKYDENF